MQSPFWWIPSTLFLLASPLAAQSLDCTTLEPDPFEDNDSCANAVAVPSGAYLGDLTVTRSDRDFYRFTVPAGGQLFVNTYFDSETAWIDLHLRAATDPACGMGPIGSTLAPTFTTPNGRQVLWNNVDSLPWEVILEVRIGDGDMTKNCQRYDMVPLVIDPTGPLQVTAYCGPAEPNSAGMSTQLTGRATSAPGAGLHLDAWDGPIGEFGYFLVGTHPDDPGVLVGDGRLCLDTTTNARILRYNLSGGAHNSLGQFGFGGFYNWSGTSTTAFGFDVPGTLPDEALTPIVAGQTLYFQLWHRDRTPGGSNFSNAVAVEFF